MGIILLSLQVSCYNRKDIGGVFMPDFKLVSPFSPMGVQITAIEQLLDGIKAGKKEQVLLINHADNLQEVLFSFYVRNLN